MVAASQAASEEPPGGTFEAIGEPVHIGRLHATCVGPDNRGQRKWVYFAFAQGTAGPPFLLVVDPDTGTVGQFHPPKGCEVNGFKSLYAGKDGSIYIGGYQPARLLRFDPRQPKSELQDLGVLPGASMVWWFAEAADGRLYMTTSGSPDGSKLFSWDPKTAKIENHGRLSDENEYATHLRVSSDGSTLYAVVAPQKYDVVAFDVRSGQRRGLLPDAHRGHGDFPGIFRGDDIRRQTPKIENGPLVDEWLYAEMANKRYVLVDRVAIDPGQSESKLQDGRRMITSNAEELLIAEKDGKERNIPLQYKAGTEVFTLHSDPNGKLYGATHAPLQLFS
jgi:hypothetical protein